MKNLFKIFSIIGLLSLSLFAVGNIGQAEVDEYTVTIKKLELYNSTTAKWIVLSSSSAAIDIASGTAGSSIGAMVSDDAALTFGVYTKVRTLIGNTFIIQACTTAPNVSCTNNTINNGGANVVSGLMTFGAQRLPTAMTGTNRAASTPITMTIDFSDSGNITLPAGVTVVGTDVLMETTLPASFTINETTTSPSISVNFNLDNVLTSTTIGAGANLDADGGGDDNYIIIDFPTVSISIQ